MDPTTSQHLHRSLVPAIFALLLFSSNSLALAQQCLSPGINNRGVAKLTFRSDASDAPMVEVLVHLSLGDGTKAKTNASFDLQVRRNGTLVGVTPYDAVANGAITCAVTCASKCGSIFGDGVCSNCNCNYFKAIPFPIPDARDGDVISAKIVPTRGGEREVYRYDDRMSRVFHSESLER